MGEEIQFLIRFGALSALMWMLFYMSKAKLLLGALLIVAGAFFPEFRTRQRQQHGEGEIRFPGALVKFSGSLRALVIIAGIVVLVGGMVEGYHSGKSRSKEVITYLDHQIGSLKSQKMQYDQMIITQPDSSHRALYGSLNEGLSQQIDSLEGLRKKLAD